MGIDKVRMLPIAVGVLCCGALAAALTSRSETGPAAGRQSAIRALTPSPSVKAVAEAVTPSGVQSVKLGNGVSVDLLAIAPNAEGNGEKWWDASGKMLKQIPGRNNALSPVQYQYGQGGRPLSILMRLSGSKRLYIGTTGNVIDPDGMLEQHGYIVRNPPEDNGWISPQQSATGCMHVWLPNSVKTFGYRFGVATGAWKTIAVTPYAPPGAQQIRHATQQYIHTVSIVLGDHPAIKYQDTTLVWHSLSLLGTNAPLGDVDRWVTAVDAKGNDVHFDAPLVNAHGIRSVSMEPEDLAKVAQFRLQTRPYAWAEFKNIHAMPQSETNLIRINSVEALPMYSHVFRSGVGIQLTAVHRFPVEGGEWWQPDGTLLPGTPTKYKTLSDDGVTAASHARPVAYTVTGPPGSTFNIVWKVLGARHSQQTPIASPDEPVNETGNNDYGRAYYNQYPDNPSKMILKVGLAGGNWQAAATRDVDFHPDKLLHRNIDPNRDYEGDVSLRVGLTVHMCYADSTGKAHDELLAKIDPGTNAYRLVAVMENGDVKPITRFGFQYETLFNLALDSKSNLRMYNKEIDLAKIRQIQVQSRPYEWSTFKDVALNPAKQVD